MNSKRKLLLVISCTVFYADRTFPVGKYTFLLIFTLATSEKRTNTES